jgi:hypothetical protein
MDLSRWVVAVKIRFMCRCNRAVHVQMQELRVVGVRGRGPVFAQLFGAKG